MDWLFFPRQDKLKSLALDVRDEVHRFLTSMASVAEKYNQPEVIGHITRITESLTENLWVGFLMSKQVFVTPPSVENADIPVNGGWELTQAVLMALEVVGAIDAKQFDGGWLVDFSEGRREQLRGLKNETLNHSAMLDVHRGSDHPEVTEFVDQIFEAHIGTGNINIRKKHLKVLLLDLYVRWEADPSLKTSVSFDVNAYDPGSRYNALHISKMTIEVVRLLAAEGLLYVAPGYFNQQTGDGRTSRVWPTRKLVAYFQKARFSVLDVWPVPETEVVILRKGESDEGRAKDAVEYDDTPRTIEMREKLRAYNELLRDTFVDIPTLEKPYIEDFDQHGTSHRIAVNQGDKFTRRIFNRGSFDLGGRHYGGWWQRCPKDFRHSLFLNDQPVTEVDYSGLHLVLLYATSGIDYWKADGVDPYDLDIPELGNQGIDVRAFCKLLVLVALNAKDQTSTCQAFRNRHASGSMEKSMSNEEIIKILDALRERHAPIADAFAGDAGITLQNQDSRITEAIIDWFVHEEIPILAIHDSYIVPMAYEQHLIEQMDAAFAAVTGIKGAKVKPVIHNPWEYEPLDAESAVGFNFESWNEAIKYRFNPPRAERYQREWARFKDWMDSRGKKWFPPDYGGQKDWA